MDALSITPCPQNLEETCFGLAEALKVVLLERVNVL